MSTQKIKICGVNDLSILEEIVNLEIDYVGFIFFEKSYPGIKFLFKSY